MDPELGSAVQVDPGMSYRYRWMLTEARMSLSSLFGQKAVLQGSWRSLDQLASNQVNNFVGAPLPQLIAMGLAELVPDVEFRWNPIWLAYAFSSG